MNKSVSLPDEFLVKVVPKASRNEIVGWTDDCLRVRVTAPPVDGRANDALVDLLSDCSGIPPSAFRVVSGARARIKRIRVVRR